MQKLAFGTDGVRGRVGEFPFTPVALQVLGCALGHWMTERYGQSRVKVLLAGDTRESVNDIKQFLFDSMGTFAIDIVDAGVIPTPAVLTLIQQDQTFSCGLVISASHNPHYDNGIKLFDRISGKLLPEDEMRIEELFDQYVEKRDGLSTALKPFDRLRASGVEGNNEQRSNLSSVDLNPLALSLSKGLGLMSSGRVYTWPEAAQTYVDYLLAILPPQLGAGRTIVLDCANGATYQTAPAVFKALGAQVIMLHDTPNGININDHAGALHPEALQKAVVENKADIGFAFDGDGDRVVMVNANGELKDGDDILALLLDLEEYAQEPVVVGTVMSNSGFEAFLSTRSKSLVRVAVGDKYVAAKLDELEVLLGGEPSGHIVLKNYLPSGDGILVAAKILQAVQLQGRWQLDYVTKYPQLIVNVPVKARRDLQQEPYAGILHMYDKIMQNGRILVRYSGTEPLLRIMVEAQDEQTTKRIAQQLAHDLQQALSA